MEETLFGLIGIAALYATVHFFVLSFTKAYEKRTKYEKFISIAAIVFISLIYLNIMME